MHKNALTALCEVAGRERWCWQIACSTCGHTDFLYGLMQLDWGRHPADEDWVPKSEYWGERKPLGDETVPRRHLESGCEKLYLICASASIIDLAGVCPFPDYLGYMGLVLYHLEHLEKNYLLLTKLWGAELQEMSNDVFLDPFVGDRQPETDRLEWTDLSRFEDMIRAEFRLGFNNLPNRRSAETSNLYDQ